MSDPIDAIPHIRNNLAEEIGAEEWDNARVSLRQLSEALDQLSEKLGLTQDGDEFDRLTAVYNAACEQWNDANGTVREAGRQ